MVKANKTVVKAACAVLAGMLIIGLGYSVKTNYIGVAKKMSNDAPSEKEYKVSYIGIKKGEIVAGASVHDPSILEVDGTYYIYGSHMATAKSEDLRTWTLVGDGYTTQNKVYGDLMSNNEAFKYTGSMFSAIPTDNGGCHVWAPDVIYNKVQKLYYMYYCTSSTWNASNLCYGVSKSPEGPFEWKGALMYSGFTSETLKSTDVLDYVSKEHAQKEYIDTNDAYNFEEYPNAIDPTVFYDADGKMWMVYGSWSGGIYLLEINEETGQVIHPKADPENNVDAYFGKRLIGGKHNSIEGPYILYDKTNGYYYMFVSYGKLNREGGYQIRVFRSKKVDGEYVDMNGGSPQINAGNHSYFGLKLSGNYILPSLEKAYMATGHNSAFIDSDDKKYIVNHTRFDDGSENHEPRVHQYFLNKEGWPCMLPYATDGETISTNGYSEDKVIGAYYVIDQGMNIDSEIAEPIKLILTKYGNVYGDGIEGTWKVDKGSCFMSIDYNNQTYQGVFCEMKDEAGTKVMTFSAVGSDQSVWGVKY